MSFRSMTVSTVLVAILLAAMTAAARETVETPHFLFVHNGGASGLAERLSEIAEARRNYIRYMVGLEREDNEKVEVRIAVDEDEMQQMTGASGRVEKWIAGLTFRGADLIVMSARGSEYFKASDTFVHELAHLYLDKVVGDRSSPGGSMKASRCWPRPRTPGKGCTHSCGQCNVILIRLTNWNSFPERQPAASAYAQSMFFIRCWAGSGGVRELIDDLEAGMPSRPPSGQPEGHLEKCTNASRIPSAG